MRRSTLRGLGVVAEERPPTLGRREIALLSPFFRPYLGAGAAAVALMVVATLLKLLGPILLRRAVDSGIVPGDLSKVNFYGGLFVVIALAGFVIIRAAMILMGTAGEKMLRDLRVEGFRHLTGLSLGFFERERSGRMVARVTSDIEAAERLFTEIFVQMATQILFMMGAAVIIFTFDPRLALAAVSVVPLMVVATLLFRRASERVYQNVRERVASVLSFLQETLRGVHVVQAFARERSRAGRFGEVNADWEESNVDAFRIEAYYFPVMELLGWIGTAAVILYGGTRVLSGDLSAGVFTAFLVYLNSFFDPIHHLSEQYMAFRSGVAGLARVAQLLDTKPEIIDRPGARAVDSLAGHIVLEGVSFAYRPGAPLALEKVNLEIAPGETVALVGPTGAGKSTIVKLLARFYDVTEGSLSIDGIDIRELSQESLRSRIALVPQEGFLFGGTIRDNIRFGKPSASDAQVEEVCRLLGIDDFAGSLPEGYETDVRERGARLSAGERQLIALARAVIAEPSLILLDEATSSLDSATEGRIERAFHAALGTRSCVLIAHRLSTAMRADRIAVVDGGRILETGTHDELVNASGKYAAMYRFWLSLGADVH